MDESSASASRKGSTPARAIDLDHPFIAAVGLVLVVFAIRSALDPLLGERSPFLLFTVSIVIAAGRYGTAAGLVSVLLSLIIGTAVFMARGFPPELLPNEWASLAVFIVTSAAMLSFAGHLTRARKREQQLEIAIQQQRTDAAMGSMAATLAHELNQPLAAASNYIGASKRLASELEGKAQSTVIVGLREAELQIQRAGDIIRHARNMVSSASAARQRASLATLIGNVLRPLRASGTCTGSTLHVEVEPEADSLAVNPIQIEQVLLNLIRNACQAVTDADEQDIFVSGRGAEDFALVEVRDSGPGISDERMAILFSPHAKPSNGGLGLGLPISRTIIEAHGGRIWAENNSNGGASFFFTVPRER